MFNVKVFISVQFLYGNAMHENFVPHSSKINVSPGSASAVKLCNCCTKQLQCQT
jgi:hypothetical protein